MLADVFSFPPEALPSGDDLKFSYENLEELLDPKHRLRLQTVQARRPGLVRKCLHSLDFSFAESFKQSGGCVRKNQHPMVRFFGLYSIELNKIASPC